MLEPSDDVASAHTFSDTLYVDNTYLSAKFEFPSQADALQELVASVERHRNFRDYTVLVGIDSLGKERLLVDLAMHFGTRVEVRNCPLPRSGSNLCPLRCLRAAMPLCAASTLAESSLTSASLFFMMKRSLRPSPRLGLCSYSPGLPPVFLLARPLTRLFFQPARPWHCYCGAA